MFSAADVADLQALAVDSFTQTFDVYTENLSTGPTGGRFDVLAASGKRCRFVVMPRGRTVSGPVRAEPFAYRQLVWDASYTLPDEHVQLLINGERWQPEPGSIEARRAGASGTVLMWSAVVTRVVA